MSIEEIVSSLDEIFRKNPSERSTHLKHWQLSDGKIFWGKFGIESEDGSEVTVTHVGSKKRSGYFKYYSIKITKKDGETHFINIDPSRNEIIDSVDGKPTINDYGKMKFYTMQRFLNENEWANDVSKYIKEITWNETNGETKVVKSVQSSESPADIIAERELDVLRELKNLEENPEAEDPFIF